MKRILNQTILPALMACCAALSVEVADASALSLTETAGAKRNVLFASLTYEEDQC